MEINRENYEIWAIDYLEGKLSTSESAEFILFLAENPDLSVELDTIRELTIPLHEPVEKVDFSALKKDFSDTSLSADSFEEYCIAYYENDLTTEQVTDLLAYVKISAKNQYIFDTYGKTIAHADESIRFKNKHLLKKATQIKWGINQKRVYAGFAIAASVLLLFTFSVLLRNNTTPQEMISSESHPVNELPQKIFTDPLGSAEVAKDVIAFSETAVQSSSLTPQTQGLEINTKATEVFDTNEVQDVFIPASRLQLSTIPNATDENYIVLNQPLYSFHRSSDKASKVIIESLELSGYNTVASVKRINFDLILRKSVNGINQVAETDLQYNSETDDDGRLLAFALSSDRFNIRKKFRN